MQTSDYLNQLQNDKADLASKLSEKGVTVSNDMTFTELVPKIDDIKSGGGRYAPNYISFYNYTGDDLNYELENLDTSNITDMNATFYGCSNLEDLDLSDFDTSNVTTMNNMFNGCKQLKNLNIESFNLEKVDACGMMFVSASNLTNLYFGYNLGKGFTINKANDIYHRVLLSVSSTLTHDSLMSVINRVYELSRYTQTLQMGETNIAKLTAEEIAIATNKGWTVS